MIVKDEESFLEECLLSVKGYVDEVIVIDTGSTDKTVDVAKKHGAKVFSVLWQDFAQARNAALEKATGDWILVLDADERIAPEDLLKIRELTTNAKIQGISLQQRTYTNKPAQYGWHPASGPFAQGFIGYYPTQICRVFRNRPHIRFRYKIHELVEPSILERKGTIVRTEIPIHHYGERRPARDKKQFYLALGLAQLKETPNDPKPCYDVAQLYRDMEKLDLALAFFEKAAALDEKYQAPYTCIGDIQLLLAHADKAKTAYEKSIALKNDINAWVNLGVVHDKAGRDKDAARCFEKALSLDPLFAQAYTNIYALLVKTKRYVAAWRVLKVAAEKTGMADFITKKEMFTKKLLAALDKELAQKPNDATLLAARREVLEE
ncbi:glycosyltransferase [Candidatus Woesearchaeota archaeon]|nr:glycosyltransferase [Candidatus Woesearchaeota archaeon]